MPISHLIIFIASIVVAAGVAGTLTTQVEGVSQAIDDQGLDVSQEIRTDIEVISDASSNQVYDGSAGELTLLVKNTGSRTLPSDADQVDVLVNGSYQGDVALSVLDGPAWEPTTVAEVTVSNVSLPAGDHRVKVIVKGDEEVFEFRV